MVRAEQQETAFQSMSREEQIRERLDKDGIKWVKAYFGGGAHFKNWLNQFVDLYGEQNVIVEEADPQGFRCFEESGEKMYRIWVKDADRP